MHPDTPPPTPDAGPGPDDVRQRVLGWLAETTGIPRDQLAGLAGLSRLRTLAVGERFVDFDEWTDRLGILARGVVKVVALAGDDQPFTRAFCRPLAAIGAYGDMSAGVPSSVRVEALTTCEILVLSYSELMAAADTVPIVHRVINGVLDRELNRKYQKLALDRIADISSRYKEFQRLYPGLEAEVPQKDVASYMGIRPETLSRLRARNRALRAGPAGPDVRPTPNF